MTNAVIMGASGGANSIKGTDDVFRVQKGKSVKKGDFLTFDYYSESVDTGGASSVYYTDNHGTSSTFGVTHQRDFKFTTANSVTYTESVVKNACTVNTDGTHTKHFIIGIALQNGESLQAIRVKRVTSAKSFSLLNPNLRPYPYYNNDVPLAFRNVYEDAQKLGLYGKELIDYINENYS